MRHVPLAVSLCTVFLVCPVASAQIEASPEQALQGFLELLKPSLIEAVPQPLYERSYDWGRQSKSFHALKWNGLKPRVVKTPKNDGTWRKIRVETRHWPACLKLQVHDVRQPDPERLTFKIYLSFDVTVNFDQQNWENGIRLYSGNIRARMRIHSVLDCETTMKLDTSAGLLPDLLIRMRVTRAQVHYDNLVVEHFAGFGGAAARIVGDMLHDTVNQWRPSLERRLLERANHSVVRAADTREVRLAFSKLIKK